MMPLALPDGGGEGISASKNITDKPKSLNLNQQALIHSKNCSYLCNCACHDRTKLQYAIQYRTVLVSSLLSHRQSSPK